MRTRLIATIAVAVVGALVAPAPVVASAAAAGASGTRAQPTQVTWESCGGGECATLTVPFDPDRPRNGKTAGIALFRVPVRDPAQRIGSLLVNPGGPGASGVAFVRDLYPQVPEELKDRFDIVGFDPRGTAGTLPIDCGDVIDQTFALDYTPDTPEERAALLDGTRAVVEECRAANRGILKHVSTRDTVRDMDRIRRALGDPQLTFLGYSYGTYLGALYADAYPKKVRAMVLDGGVDPELTSRETSLQQAVGFEQSLSAFLQFCSDNRSCSFRNGGDAASAFDRLAAALDAAPLPADDGRVLGPGLFAIGVVRALYFGESSYAELGDALTAAAAGDAAPLLALADEYTGRNQESNRNLLEAFWAIGCRDGPSAARPDRFEALEPEYRAAAPRLGVALLNLGLVCALWPIKPVKSVLPLRARGAPPILVIGTVGDPATPPQWAAGLADELDSGVLLEAQGGRHASFVLGRVPCVDEYGVRYLVDLVAPPAGAQCGLPI